MDKIRPKWMKLTEWTEVDRNWSNSIELDWNEPKLNKLEWNGPNGPKLTQNGQNVEPLLRNVTQKINSNSNNKVI